MRDFIIAHYKVTRRGGDPFWDHVRTMEVPDSLAERARRCSAPPRRFFKHGAAELFAEESWVQVLLGQGFEARADPVTRFVADEELAGFLGDIAEVIDDVAAKMPDHGAFVARLPSASGPQAAAGSAAGFQLDQPAASLRRADARHTASVVAGKQQPAASLRRRLTPSRRKGFQCKYKIITVVRRCNRLHDPWGEAH